jgi:hypothetical protein
MNEKADCREQIDHDRTQDINAARGPAPRAAPAAPGNRRYLLAGLLACGACGRPRRCRQAGG